MISVEVGQCLEPVFPETGCHNCNRPLCKKFVMSGTSLSGNRLSPRDDSQFIFTDRKRDVPVLTRHFSVCVQADIGRRYKIGAAAADDM